MSGPVVAAVRVYAEAPDGAPLIIDVPAGELTTQYVAQARDSGGRRIRIVALDDRGRTIDRVVVR